MEEEIALGEILAILKAHLSKILTWSFLGLLVVALYTFFLVTPTYESTSKIVVNQTQNTEQTITNTDIQTNLSLISTYQGIIKEPIILQEVLDQTGLDFTLEELSEKITIQTEENSLVFGVTVVDESPYVAAEIANATATSFSNSIGGIMDVRNVTILSEATPSEVPVSPNIPLNLILGLLVGIIIGIGLAFINEFMDQTVKEDKYLESLGWTNLGSILEMSTEEINDTRLTFTQPVRQQVAGRLSRRRV